jgi:hypothetical protein
MRWRAVQFLAVLWAAATPGPALAAWPWDPEVGLPVCTAPGVQRNIDVSTDGAGGTFVVWLDLRAPQAPAAYVQHLLAEGSVDPSWPQDGWPAGGLVLEDGRPRIADGGPGAAIVVWSDTRTGTSDVYAQRVTSPGPRDGRWPAGGLAACSLAVPRRDPVVAPDGLGGAFVVWRDLRSGASNLWAQHLLESGARDPAWPADGVAVCLADGTETSLGIVACGPGMAIVVWSGGESVYCQRLLLSGVDAAWPANGVEICGAWVHARDPRLASDGDGGAIVSWWDRRRLYEWDVCAQHVTSAGFVDPAWPADGLAVCEVARDQMNPEIVPDGTGGAIVTWADARAGVDWGIYAQRVLASGEADPAWPAGGLALCATDSSRWRPRIVADGEGGAIVAWFDLRAGDEFDVYAQRARAGGSVDAAWPASGAAVSLGPRDQYLPTLVADGTGGAIVAWEDTRTPGSAPDILAQRVDARGRLGGPAIVAAASAGPGPPAVVPNPGRAAAILRFETPRAGPVRVVIHDAAGRRVREWVHRFLREGRHEVAWPFDDDAGLRVAPGVYLATFEWPGARHVRRIVALR